MDGNERTPLLGSWREKRTAAATERATSALLRAADGLRRRFTAVVEPHGITVQQYHVLRILLGAQPDPLPTLEIAERMIEQTPGVTRLLDRLEEKELVERERSTTDRRVVFCALTEAGSELVRRILEEVDEAGQEAMGALRARHIEQLAKLLEGIADPV